MKQFKYYLFLMALVLGLNQANAQIIITGFLSEPPGADAPVGGGYEYIQLMATQDINFSTATYAVVVGSKNGGTVVADGWAAGGNLTYKFNLTSGTVNKGEFFYVGNTKKLINGPGSTDISTAKWIRIKDINSETGDDGMGNAGLANFLPTAKNTACGIAVFAGTNVTASSVPIDAVFYGDNIGNAYKSPNGYLLPSNDLYSPNLAQNKFGMGANTSALVGSASTADDSNFYSLGGVFNTTTSTWVTARNATLIALTASSTLATIESGAGVTVLPVKLTAFSGKKQQNGIQLQWTTASEKNNSHFEILHSSDGAGFKVIGKVQGNGNADIPNMYSFTDPTPLPGINYYQLNQVDFDGQADKSAIISVNAGLELEQFKITGIESRQINALVYAAEAASGSIRITDVSGRVLADSDIQLEPGHNQLNLPVSSLNKGIYIASLIISGKTASMVKFMGR